MTRLMYVGILAGIAFFINCSNMLNEDSANLGGGNGSGAGSPKITGMFYEPDGTTPASGIMVFARDRQSTAAVNVPFTMKRNVDYIATTTDVSGRYSFMHLDAGLYVIEGCDGSGNIARHDSVYLDTTKEPVVLPSDTLKPSGAISGKVIQKNGNTQQTFVLIFGVDRFCQLDTNSRFIFSGLAEGTFRIKIVSLDSQFGHFDTSGITVRSCDTSDIGIINLPLHNKNIPVLTATYDTLSTTATLVWNRVPGSKGYNIYRIPASGRQIDTSINFNNDPMNGSIVYTDTVFMDNLKNGVRWMFDEGTYPSFDYRIASVDSFSNQGPQSFSQRIEYVNSWVSIDTLFLSLPSSPIQQVTTCSSDSRFQLATGTDWDHIQLHIYSKDGTPEESFSVPLEIYGRSFSNISFLHGEDPMGTIWYTAFSADTLFMCRINKDGSIYMPLALMLNSGILSGDRFYQFDSTTVYYTDLKSGLLVRWMELTNINMRIHAVTSDGKYGVAVDLIGKTQRIVIHYSSDGTELKRLTIPNVNALDVLGKEGELIGIRDSVFHFEHNYYLIRNTGFTVCGTTWFPYRNTDVWTMLRTDGTYAVLVKPFSDILTWAGAPVPQSGTVVIYRLQR